MPGNKTTRRSSMSIYSLSNFLQKYAQKPDVVEAFQLESDQMLKIDLNGDVWIKTGSMVAYKGVIKFTREKMMEHGLGKAIMKSITGEGATLTKAQGRGELFLADNGKRISVIYLDSNAITVNGNDLLAFSPSIQWDIKFLKNVSSIMAGGLFNMQLSGRGYVAITTHYKPLILMVTPDKPVVTDPHATVAWSSNLIPELKTDINLGTFIGRSSGETFQMFFRGQGFVVVQPYEEVTFQHS